MVQRKRIIILILCSIFLFTGYTFPEGSPYLDVQTNQGRLKIYFTVNAASTLMYDDVNHKLINTGNSTIYGYVTEGTNEYRITFPVYDIPYYSQSYNNTIYYNSIEILENYRVKLYTEFNSDMTTYIGVVIILLLFFLLFKR